MDAGPATGKSCSATARLGCNQARRIQRAGAGAHCIGHQWWGLLAHPGRHGQDRGGAGRADCTGVGPVQRWDAGVSAGRQSGWGGASYQPTITPYAVKAAPTPARGRKTGRLGLGRVNAHHGQLKVLINERCRGVATRYLASYFGWHRAMMRAGFMGKGLLDVALAAKRLEKQALEDRPDVRFLVGERHAFGASDA